MPKDCKLRRVKYLNDVIEQDHPLLIGNPTVRKNIKYTRLGDVNYLLIRSLCICDSNAREGVSV